MNYFRYVNKGRQTTIKSPFVLEGIGAFSGNEVKIECQPLEENKGVVFHGPKGRYIRASYENIGKNKIHSHTTELTNGSVRIAGVEHILSAFYGLGVDNVLIKITEGEELPIFDSSSLAISEKIIQAGIIKLRGERKILKVLKKFVVNNKKSNGLAIVKPHKTLKINAAISFNNIIGFQKFTFKAGRNYIEEISPARSFLMEAFNRGKWDLLRRELKFLPKDRFLSNVIIYDESKFITKLRFKNEPIRHKILDFLGDLSLLGCRVEGEIFVYRPGHSFTREIVKKIVKHNEVGRKK